MKDDVLLSKAETIERCVKRIEEEYIGFAEQLTTNFTKQDSIILNIQRACEASIDMATRVIRLCHLGLPQSSREVFVLLEQAKIIDFDLSKKMQSMVGFRNIAVHNYTQLNLEIVRAIVEHNLSDFLQFSKVILKKDFSNKNII